ncbi:hypothetical protein M407DRAFT_245816 [Tulasnella calospora MUT 4182]|uniref:Uncharacterized protein n=1 Tax=Tulasnella calospora MUT 4182 TaxID=1051891 RepID=A0A0C3Q363_9AGAM|nr:hypothetical protein M407DRAFT_246868 [Tulasnella calospora MUT 4182]KIO20423.1 hypothetical protein M407DRAFT_245816 [Tulasnella calospora MUT 4182]
MLVTALSAFAGVFMRDPCQAVAAQGNTACRRHRDSPTLEFVLIADVCLDSI